MVRCALLLRAQGSGAVGGVHAGRHRRAHRDAVLRTDEPATRSEEVLPCPTPTSIPSSRSAMTAASSRSAGRWSKAEDDCVSIVVSAYVTQAPDRPCQPAGRPAGRRPARAASSSRHADLALGDGSSGSSRPRSQGGPFREGWAYASAELVENAERRRDRDGTRGRSGCGCATRSAARYERGRRPRRRGCPRRAARAARPPTRGHGDADARVAAVEHRPPARPEPPPAARAAHRRARRRHAAGWRRSRAG